MINRWYVLLAPEYYTESTNVGIDYCTQNACQCNWICMPHYIATSLNTHLTGTISLLSATYGPGVGPVLLSNLHCIGTERNITQCAYSANTLCDHSTDAGVICKGKTY